MATYDEISIVYIAGAGRSGSTVLDRVFGTLPNVSSFNELRVFFSGTNRDNLCACGEPLHTCPLWSEMDKRMLSLGCDFDELQRLHNRVNHTRHIHKIVTNWVSGSFKQDLAEYQAWLRHFYFNLAELSESPVIVDSSKVPGMALILSQVPGINVHVVHLVRDVRGVVYSWQKVKSNPGDGGLMTQYAPMRTVRFWAALNLVSEYLAHRLPYTRVRYEDFAANPASTMADITGSIAALQNSRVPFLNEHEIELQPLHSISGNPDRFTSGLVEIKTDDKWKAGLESGVRNQVTRWAAPLIKRYGYALDPS